MGKVGHEEMSEDVSKIESSKFWHCYHLLFIGVPESGWGGGNVWGKQTLGCYFLSGGYVEEEKVPGLFLI